MIQELLLLATTSAPIATPTNNKTTVGGSGIENRRELHIVKIQPISIVACRRKFKLSALAGECGNIASHSTTLYGEQGDRDAIESHPGVILSCGNQEINRSSVGWNQTGLYQRRAPVVKFGSGPNCNNAEYEP